MHGHEKPKCAEVGPGEAEGGANASMGFGSKEYKIIISSMSWSIALIQDEFTYNICFLYYK